MNRTAVARRTAVLISLSLWLCAGTGTATAHQGDSRIVTSVEAVSPALPAGVVVESRAGIAAQLVAANPTSTPLDIIARGGEAFLRISSAGVQANLNSPDFYETSNPNGSTAGVPERVKRSGGRLAPSFVQVSSGSSWGWYDHRLHPRNYQAPTDVARAATLARFEIPLRYGTQAVTAVGRVTFQPLLGAFRLDTAEVPDGLSADVLQGRLPGLLLSAKEGTQATVLGRDGEPFLRFGPSGAEINEASRTHVEDRQARGLDVPPPGGQPRWKAVGGTSYSWLDARLRYASDAPPPEALRSSTATDVQDWSIPVLLAGQPAAVTGVIRWVPTRLEGSGKAPAQSTGSSGRDDGPAPVAWLAGAGLLLLAAIAAIRLRGRRT